tara:strand:- start:85 stop:354 length:270 start_codon:yes stop_codon:yes gene_type:complete
MELSVEIPVGVAPVSVDLVVVVVHTEVLAVVAVVAATLVVAVETMEQVAEMVVAVAHTMGEQTKVMKVVYGMIMVKWLLPIVQGSVLME